MRLCQRYQTIVIPGVNTPTELMRALEMDVDVCKVFPAAPYGPAIISAFRDPFPQAQLVPTGGVNPDNVKEWIRAGSFAVGAGGELTAGARTGDFTRVSNTARQFIQRINEARAELAG